jgi:hypothetical protein
MRTAEAESREMTTHDPIKAASEELAGMQEVWKVIHGMARAAELKASEAEAELNALLKARAAITIQVEQHQRRVRELRTAAETQAHAVGAQTTAHKE